MIIYDFFSLNLTEVYLYTPVTPNFLYFRLQLFCEYVKYIIDSIMYFLSSKITLYSYA